MGFGNEAFFSTEIEESDQEYRLNGRKAFVKLNPKAVYVRVWLGYKVYVLSTNEGWKVKSKNKKAFKFLLGIEGA